LAALRLAGFTAAFGLGPDPGRVPRTMLIDIAVAEY